MAVKKFYETPNNSRLLLIIDSRIYCELAAWTHDGGVFASVSLVSCERVDQAEEPEHVDFVNLEKS